VLNQVHGTSIPIGIKPVKPGIPFFPNYLYRDSIAWAFGILLLFWLALMFPVHLGGKADPLTSAPLGIRPEWYFLALFETLRLVPASVAGVSGEMIVNLGVTLLGLILLLIPFIDRKAANEERSRVFTIVGIVFVLYVACAISLAYLT
jgi:cytochrome b6